ncbi:MAG TPA: methyltransferase type 11 [Gallionella sp.]|nr:methyltransferase type 11 [Gallionella sp.]
MADQGTEGLLSPWLRRKRFEASAPYLKGRVLDFGCGSGAMAGHVDADNYLGVEIDEVSLQQARSGFPTHQFVSEPPEQAEKFDSVISLAVIEHVSDPAEFLRTLATHLNELEGSRLIVTTPHPSVDWVHHVGASLGLFSRHADEEHEDLLDKEKLESAGAQAGLKLISYQRFLFGANQIAVYKKDSG